MSSAKPVPAKSSRRTAAKIAGANTVPPLAPDGPIAFVPAPECITDASAFKEAILRHLTCTQARDVKTATPRDWWIATAMATRDHILSRMILTQAAHHQANARRLYYLSLEYLMGRLLDSSLHNTGVHEVAVAALKELGQDYEALKESEVDMGLGNGGLGRLAACFLDSLATLDLPAVGYGIHYEFGLFKQAFERGHQIEHPDSWIIFGDPWEVLRSEYTQKVQLYGHVENVFDDRGGCRPKWVGTRTILGVPHDIPIPGFGTQTVNFLRLWESKSTEEFDLQVFNQGGYVEAVREKALGETVSKVLYPNDKTENGKELRLVQQYFFVCCSIHDLVRRHFKHPDNTWDNFAAKVAIQLNDTHPAVAVAELMRLLLDEHELSWDRAWSIVTQTFAYTNHTLLPEALEKWGVPLFGRVLPRHLQIIFEINTRLMAAVAAKWPGDVTKLQVCSLIDDAGAKSIRMANLAVVGSHAVNGVAALHTKLLKADLFPEFDAFYPGKFQNKTNGITPRRWLLDCNPRLSDLITARIGAGWARNLDELKKLERFADDAVFREAFMAVKRANKVDLAAVIKADCGVEVSPDALFDVQIKRLHEYKRQHLNLLHILTLYRRLLRDPSLPITPRVFVFAAKAAPGYDLAKNIIRAINIVGERINQDARIGGKLKVVFLPNYRVSLAEKIIPAADLSEQISTAGKEASGTGNMKLSLNGALTIGTLDGANVEIGEEVGDDHIFICGLTVEQVVELRAKGYNPWDFYHRDEELKAVIDWLDSNFWLKDEPHAFKPLVDSVLHHGDPFLVCADYRSYVDTQDRVGEAYKQREQWARSAILNTARMGKFSSDRTIREYARDIWSLPPVAVK